MAKKTAKVEKIWATGRRKKAIARARLSAGTGKILVNKVPLAEYFKSELLQNEVKTALTLVEATDKYDIEISVSGGGLTGQAGACRHAIARGLVLSNETYKHIVPAVVKKFHYFLLCSSISIFLILAKSVNLCNKKTGVVPCLLSL